MHVIAVRTVAETFDWLAGWLPADEVDLTRRATVLCGAGRAHAFRRVLASGQRLGRLAGVRFLEAAVCARELLARTGNRRIPGWEEVRRLRIHQAFAAGRLQGRLHYFDADQLQSGRGYADAFARVIAELEDSGLTSDLALHAADAMYTTDAFAAHRLHDVATVWGAVDTDLGVRRSRAGLFAEAAAALRCAPECAAWFGPVAAFVTASPSSVLVQFLSALPDCTVVFFEARPLRAGTQRWRQTLPLPATADGDEPAENVSELALVRRFLFAPSEVMADAARPRSAGADGTVDFEEYASLEDEIDAAALWVHQQLVVGTALEEIALVVPALDPHARLLLGRLSRPGTPHGPSIPVYVAGGLPLTDAPAGLRVGNLLRALLGALEAEATIALLPGLQGDPRDEQPPLSPSRAKEIIYDAGIVGGGGGDVRAALEWVPRLRQRWQTLQAQLMALPEAGSGDPEQRSDLHTRREIERWLADVHPLWPAIEALQTVAASIIDGAALPAVWRDVRKFAVAHLRVPPDPPDWLARLDDALARTLVDPVAESVTGFAAVAHLIETLIRVRVPHGRFGEPRVFIGPAASAAGLSFRAVRVLGLAEGIMPGTPHDDPIIPNDVRAGLEAHLRAQRSDIVIPQLEDAVLEDLHAFCRVVAGARERLALSAARQWVDRSEREVSGVMIEVAAALGRPPRANGEGDVPNAARLRSVYCAPGRASRDAAAKASLQPRALLAHAPYHDAQAWHVPAHWCHNLALALDRVHTLSATTRATDLAELDGMVQAPWTFVAVPGLAPAYPISASALTTLLECPHRFLLQRVLHFEEPVTRPSTDTIDPRAYGSLFHAVAEGFFRAHGEALCARTGSVEEWQTRAAHMATRRFEQWCAHYPLRGDDSIAREQHRLLNQMAQLIHLEWNMPKRRFVASEYRFGDPQPVRLVVPGGALYVAGIIDRIDELAADRFSVRDLKTGRVRDLGEEPLNPGRDLQLGLYALVLETARPGAHVAHAAYVHPSAAQEPERRFEHAELAALREQTRQWLGIANGMLAAGAFPRTPHSEDCTACPFRSVCGDGAQAQARNKLSAPPRSPEIAAFVSLKERWAHANAS